MTDIIRLNRHDPRWFVSIYQSHPYPASMGLPPRDNFGLCVPVGVVDPELLAYVPIRFMRDTGEAYVRLNSRYRPEVDATDIAHLVQQLDELRVRNQKPDRIFYGRDLSIEVKRIDYEHHDRGTGEVRKGTVLCPIKISIANVHPVFAKGDK